MTVSDLRTALAALPGDMPVILLADAEGNSHSPAAGIELARYAATSTWEGERYEQGQAAPSNARDALLITPTC